MKSKRRNEDSLYTGLNYDPARGNGYAIRRRNRAGVFGLILSILGLLTAGLLSPLGLIVSAFGMAKRPRKAATTGLVLSLLGLIPLTMFVGPAALVAISTPEFPLTVAGERKKEDNPKYQANTREEVTQAKNAIIEYQRAKGELPDGETAEELIADAEDAWGTAILYSWIDRGTFQIRSIGADRIYGTEDDILETVSLRVERDAEADVQIAHREPQTIVGEVGDILDLGNLQVSVSSVRPSEFLSTESSGIIANEGDVFLLVEYQLKNKTTKSKFFNPSSIHLLSQDGEVFKRSSKAERILAKNREQTSLLIDLPRGSVIDRQLEFEVPEAEVANGLVMVFPPSEGLAFDEGRVQLRVTYLPVAQGE